MVPLVAVGARTVTVVASEATLVQPDPVTVSV
jgi:hypothetical protein